MTKYITASSKKDKHPMQVTNDRDLKTDRKSVLYDLKRLRFKTECRHIQSTNKLRKIKEHEGPYVRCAIEELCQTFLVITKTTVQNWGLNNLWTHSSFCA